MKWEGAVEPTGRFTGRAENYARYRPGYPAGVLEIPRRRGCLRRNDIVADVGSGTGALARVFLESGHRVFGVEPNPEMRGAGETLLAGYERFTSVAGTAEQTTLATDSVDLVVAGQAFHWFDPEPARREFSRILRPNGGVLLVWNARRTDAGEFSLAYERLLQSCGTDYAEVRHDRRGAPGQIRAFFAPEPVETFVLVNAQSFDLEGLEGRMLSSSYVPAVGEPGHEEILSGLREIFDQHQSNGRVTLHYDTRLYFGRL